MIENFVAIPGVQAFLSRVGGCIARGHVLTLTELNGQMGEPHPPRTWAGVMHDHVTSQVESEFADDSEMTFFVDHQLKMLATPYALVSFKKGNSGLTSIARNKTWRSQKFGTLPLSPTLNPADQAVFGWDVSHDFRFLREMGLMEFEGRLCIDRIVIPFVDDVEESPIQSGSAFIPPLRPNLEGLKRERIERLELSEEDNENRTGN